MTALVFIQEIYQGPTYMLDTIKGDGFIVIK